MSDKASVDNGFNQPAGGSSDNPLRLKGSVVGKADVQNPAIIDVTGGSVIDIEGRVETNAIIAALRDVGIIIT